jgi:NAD(P)-dependent dehydrogenase (short-subunit alcohol dehydrogenase family)
MTALPGKTVAVTGAASGIGRALALDLVARGAHLAIADIDEAGLGETAALASGAGRVTTHLVDVRDRGAVERYASEVAAQHGGADILINNAGVVVRATIEEVSYEDFAFVLDVNLWGVIHGVKAFLPLLRRRPEAHIVNISSLNGMVPFAKNGPYNVSKYGVLGLSETLMQELRGGPIRVTCVHPGGIRTRIVQRGRGVTEEEAALFQRVAATSADQAARAILRAVERNQERVLVGADAKVIAAAKRVLPAWTVRLVGAVTWDPVASFNQVRRRLGPVMRLFSRE